MPGSNLCAFGGFTISGAVHLGRRYTRMRLGWPLKRANVEDTKVSDPLFLRYQRFGLASKWASWTRDQAQSAPKNRFGPDPFHGIAAQICSQSLHGR